MLLLLFLLAGLTNIKAVITTPAANTITTEITIKLDIKAKD